MKYAKRMVLIPETEYLERKVKAKTTKKQSDYIAAKALAQKRGKEMRMRDQGTARLRYQWKHLKDAPEPMVHVSSLYKESQPEANILDLINFLAPVYQPKAKLLLADLRSKGFTWSDNKELILPSGDKIQRSNIVDLMKEALVTTKTSKKGTPKRKPAGWRDFIGNVAMAGVPTSLFTKQSTLRDLREHRPDPMLQWDEYEY